MLTSLAALACSCVENNSNGNGDGDGDGDADAEAPVELETQVTDLATGLALFDAAVTEVGNPANTTSSAPNGRAILELSGDAAVTQTLGGYLSNRMEIDHGTLVLHAAARQNQLSELVTETDLDAIYAALSVTRDVATTQVLIYLRGSADFAPAAGASVGAGGLQTAVRRAGTPADFEIGDTVIDDALVLVINAPGSALAITTSGTCQGPTDIPLDPGQLASTFLVCD